MNVKAIDLANAAGKSRSYISQETKKKNIIRNKKGTYDTENKINKSWMIAKGIKISDLKKNIKKPIEKPIIKPKEKKVIAKTEKKPLQKLKPKKEQTKKKKITPQVKVIDIESKKKKITNENADNLTPMEFEELTGIPGKLKNYTLEQLVYAHGNIPGIKTYAETLDKIMSALKKSVEIQKIKRELIERDFFKSHVASYLEVLSEQFFDYAGTDKKMRKDFSKLIKHAKRSVDNELNKLQKIQEKISGI